MKVARVNLPGRRSSQSHGFTLIEIAITVVVLGLMIGLFIPFAVSVRNSPSPLRTEQAILLAQERLEQIVADRREVNTKGFGYATNPANYPNEAPIAGQPNFTRSVSIVCVTTANFSAAGTVPNPSCALSDGRTDYARVTVTVGTAVVGNVTAVGLVANY